MGGDLSAGELAKAFVHTLVPIAFAYVAAHYLTLLLYQGQAVVRVSTEPFGYLASNPLGEDGTDLFGTAERRHRLRGHRRHRHLVLAGGLRGGRPRGRADPRARPRPGHLRDSRLAVRSQYWMLVVMVGFTSLALWLLAQSNG